MPMPQDMAGKNEDRLNNMATTSNYTCSRLVQTVQSNVRSKQFVTDMGMCVASSRTVQAMYPTEASAGYKPLMA
jgi:hypothetical protein